MKKRIQPWIGAFRLTVTIPAGLLVHVGAKLAHQETNWLLAIEIFFIASLAMIHNDFFDRVNDVKKGRTFAHEHPREFKRVIFVGWLVVWALALTTLLQYWLILLPVILVSTFYSYTRKVLFLQSICVAATSASPIIIGHIDSRLNLLMFTVIFLSIFAREQIKDLEDRETDVGWKRTLPSSKLTSNSMVVGVAGALLSRAWLFLVVVACSTDIAHASVIAQLFVYSGAAMCLLASNIWLKHYAYTNGGNIFHAPWQYTDDEAAKEGKMVFDIAMFLILIGISIL